MSWVQTYTGKAAFPLDLQPDQVCIEDIAHSLSLICRFNGHCRFHYSVAQHAVLCAMKAPKGMKRDTLCHDNPEYLIGDVTRPLKAHLWITSPVGLPSLPFSDVELVIQQTLYRALGLEFPSEEILAKVKEIDNRMVMTEARDIMGKKPMPWNVKARPYRDRICQWSPEEAEMLFLKHYKEYTK